MFQSNIYDYYYASIKGVLCISGKDVPRKVGNSGKQIKILVHAQDSCACATLLCMHNTLVHALEGPGPKAGTKKRVLCMHKSVVHAQESCACTRILSMHNIPFSPSTIINIAPKHFFMRDLIFSFISTYTVD